MINPLFDEQMRAGFINFVMIRLHLVGLAALTFLVFLFYPSQPVSYYLARSVKPEMFNIALYTIVTFVSYLTIKAAVFSIQDTKIISMKDWFLYTKISTGTYLRGRLGYGLFYSSFLILLFLPVILVAGSVSAISPDNIAALVLILFVFTLDLYLLGLFFFVLFRKQHWILTLILWFTLLVIVFISPTFFPESHPMLLLMNLQVSDNLGEILFQPMIVSLTLAALLVLLISIIVHLYSRSIHD